MRITLRCFLSTLVILFLQLSLFGQDPAHWQLTDDDGLPSLTVYDILQDSLGFIWMGTSNGICRYDGKEFKYFSMDQLKDREIIEIRLDPFNQVWFSNLAGQLFRIEGDNIIAAKNEKNEPIVGVQDFIWNGRYMYAYFSRSQYQAVNKRHLKRYFLDKTNLLTNPSLKTPLSQLSSFVKKGSNLKFLAISNHKDIVKRNLMNVFSIDNNIEKFHFENEKLLKIDKGSLPFFYDISGRHFVFMKDENQLNEIVDNRYETIYQLESNNYLNEFIEYQNQYYLITKKGIVIANLNSKLIPERTVFKKTICNSAFIDKEQNFWVATTGEGIKVIPKMEILNYNSYNSILPNNQIYRIFKAPDNIILVGQGEAAISTISNDEIKPYIPTNSSGRILDIEKDKEGDYWVSADGRMVVLDSLFNPIKTFSNISCKKIFEDSRQNVWIGGSTTVDKYSKDVIRTFKKNDSKILPSSKVREPIRTYAITENLDSTIFIGSTIGIFTYRNSKKSILPFLENNNQVPYSVLDFAITSDSAIWVSTSGDGILKIKDDKIIERWNTSNGLASNNCKKIFVDNNLIWIATSEGLNTIDIKTGEIMDWINKSDGLPSNDINDVAVIENQVWVGTPKGLSSFPKNLSHHNAFPPPIKITSFKIWNQDTLVVDSMVLNHDQNNIVLKFAGLGFRAKGNIKYKYRLRGINENWVTTNSRIVRYPFLNPGNYLFEVFAINEDGVESEQPAVLKIVIHPPLWQTWWFILGSVLVLASLIFSFYFSRVKRIREKEEKERSLLMQVNELQQKALRLQMNPHFIYNTLNAIQYFLTVNDQKQAMLYLSRFAKLIRMIFEQSKQKEIAFSEELEFLKLYLDLEKLRFNDKVKVAIDLEEGLEEKSQNIKIPPLLLQPLIENSFKHGLIQKEGTGLVKINFSLSDNFLLCSIEDDGVGRAKTKSKENWKPKSYKASGIKTTQERLSMMNDFYDNNEESNIKIVDLKDEYGKAKGTRVNLKIRYAS